MPKKQSPEPMVDEAEIRRIRGSNALTTGEIGEAAVLALLLANNPGFVRIPSQLKDGTGPDIVLFNARTKEIMIYEVKTQVNSSRKQNLASLLEKTNIGRQNSIEWLAAWATRAKRAYPTLFDM